MKQHSPRFIAIVNDAKSRIREVSVAQVNQKLAAKHPFILIDVREDSEWDTSHLPEAVHLGKGIIERDIEKQFPDIDSEIVLYCGGGSRSALAADALQKMGYTNVFSMAGGFRGWKQAEFMVV